MSTTNSLLLHEEGKPAYGGLVALETRRIPGMFQDGWCGHIYSYVRIGACALAIRFTTYYRFVHASSQH